MKSFFIFWAIVSVVVLALVWAQVIPRQPMAVAPIRPALDHEQVQAIEALQSLRSVTHVGVSYSNYSSRVADAAIIVDRYLEHEHPPEQHPIRIAMAAYRLAMEGWGDTIRGGFAYLLAHEARQYPALTSCLALGNVGLDKPAEALASWRLAQNAPEPEWRCAEVFVDAAEKGTKIEAYQRKDAEGERKP